MTQSVVASLQERVAKKPRKKKAESVVVIDEAAVTTNVSANLHVGGPPHSVEVADDDNISIDRVRVKPPEV